MTEKQNDIVREAFPAYRRKEEVLYTVEDYMALPDDRRCELIDGVLYDMAAPRKVHQALLFELLVQMKACIEKSNRKCIVYPGPIDVQLDCDEYTMVQPDLAVLCREDDPDVHAVQGAPDFVVEIISPSNRSQ